MITMEQLSEWAELAKYYIDVIEAAEDVFRMDDAEGNLAELAGEAMPGLIAEVLRLREENARLQRERSLCTEFQVDGDRVIALTGAGDKYVSENFLDGPWVKI